ncbi:SDR family oxidoreductase [Weeksellaceae bacterium A-14]|uniref:SDR family oxidoreductase n=1 Tax=Daejeonia sp. YH14 TaxID=3439042 RepID=UPI0031E4994D
MHIDLKGKKALVGAATDGIGKAIALQLAACGASVTVVSRNEDKLKAVIGMLEVSEGQQHGYLVTDYNDFEETKAVYENFFEDHHVDILVNNTNGPEPGEVLTKNTQDYRQAFELLFQNTVVLTELALPGMIRHRFGRVINVASSSVKEPIANLVLSNTMRTAVVSYMKTLSKKVAAEGITVNTVLTGLFATERLKSLTEGNAAKQHISRDEAYRNLLDSLPMKRAGKPEEYGYLAAFLASGFSAYLTGVTIPLDGGKSDFL